MTDEQKQTIKRLLTWGMCILSIWGLSPSIAWTAQAVPMQSVPGFPGDVDLRTILNLVGTVGQPGLLAIVMVLAIRWLLGELARREAKVEAVAQVAAAAATEHEQRMAARDATHEGVLRDAAAAMQRVADVISRCPANGDVRLGTAGGKWPSVQAGREGEKP
jgi:hypothetical protein